MDIFVRGIPNNATKKQVEAYFATPFAAFGIDIYSCDKFKDRGLANITVVNATAALKFLEVHGIVPDSEGNGRAKRPLFWDRRFLKCTKNQQEASTFAIQSVAYEASERARRAAEASASQQYQQNTKITRFAIVQLHCGVWDYVGNRLAFLTQSKVARQGTVSFGRKEAVIVLGGQDTHQLRVSIDYGNCHNIVIGQYDDSAITFTLKSAPKLYSTEGEDVLSETLLALTLGHHAAKQRRKAVKKERVTSLDNAHAQIVGSCFVYRIELSDYRMLSSVRSLLSRNVKAPAHTVLSTAVIRPFDNERVPRSFARLVFELSDTGRFGSKPFPLLYQLDRLARNGVILPNKILQLLPTVAQILERYGLDAILSALRKLYRHAPLAGPDREAVELSGSALQDMLTSYAEDYDRYRHDPENPYELTKRYSHINLIHKIIVTPCGTYLAGPEPEPTNRVLRRYADRIEHFARVVFQDEDGGSVRYDPRASQSIVYDERFKGVLNRGILIAGRMFSFLGFSHSSLRSQSCWFMAPIFAEGTMKLPEHILRELGDFSNIRIPAKCAARIGQNFTDTNATVDLVRANVGTLPMIERGGYDFSDGVGTISHELLRRIWRVYGQRRLLKPTAIQIRYKGYKGMVSLDSRLPGQRLMLRDNMKKFEAGSDVCNLEICGAGFKPLPMVLNRQFIKIFEDLGIATEVFMDLQNRAVEELRATTGNAYNVASFLEEMAGGRATRLPSLIKYLDQIGLDYREDQFIFKVVEIAIITKLRDIKYRGRIPVKAGTTLYGIMDETGELAAGEIYVVEESSPEGGRRVKVQDSVVISRSPALHPGDVQIVNAVNVRAGSPLERLSNVIVFSQHGIRDLPSQLSGGDLDGDLFNVIWDDRLIPRGAYPAAEYPKVSAVELDRPVTAKDMSDFFVSFMQSDLLGMLSNVHMQLADQHDLGTFHGDCIALAGMASTAVDFSKTGIPVDMDDCPKYDRYRPDFMAPNPRIIISDKGHLDLDEEDDGDDDAFEGLDAERRGMHYYPSDKALGVLFRAIDERQFISKMQGDRHAVMPYSNASNTLIRKLLAYMKREAAQYAVLYRHHHELAVDIRTGYEDSLLDILYEYEPSPYQPVSEHEAFAGTILGRTIGAQGKPLRELSKTMRERFESVVEYTVMRIVKGDEQIQGVTDLDLLYDDSIDREVEALPRAIACLAVAVEEPGLSDRELGELESFKYVVAGVCLRELERFRITTLGRAGLRRV